MTLQYDDPNQLGYTPKKESEYCQRCFRLTHYGDQMVSLKQGIDPKSVIEKIGGYDATIAWVVDGLDLEHGFIDDFNHVFDGKTIVLIVTKSDLLVQLIDNEKYYGYIKNTLDRLHIHIDGLIVTGNYGDDDQSIFLDQLSRYAINQTIVFAGCANAGKSTLLNHLLNEQVLTISRYPGTTIDFNPMVIDNGLTIIDTPGIENSGSMLQAVDDQTIKSLLPTKPIKPKVFQIYSPQSYSVAGLIRVDLEPIGNASLVMYLENNLKIHRTPLDNAKALWSNHFGKLLKPISKREYTTIKLDPTMDDHDLTISGLGWISVHGKFKKITLTLP